MIISTISQHLYCFWCDTDDGWLNNKCGLDHAQTNDNLLSRTLFVLKFNILTKSLCYDATCEHYIPSILINIFIAHKQ